MPNATVATRSPRKKSGRWNSIRVNWVKWLGELDELNGFSVCLFGSGCGWPAFEPNQPYKEPGCAERQRDAKEPESDCSRGRGPVAVSAVHMLVRIHQVPVQTRRRIIGVGRGLLG